MTMIRKSLTAALALCALATPSWASDVCVNPQDETALKAASLQQELMVAALTCNDIALYNHFVVSYRSELQQSDAALQAYFVRANARTGIADYHAYKTRLANQSSLSSIHDLDYCADAKASFDGALEGSKTSLAQLVAARAISGSEDFVECDGSQTVAGNEAALPSFLRTASRRN